MRQDDARNILSDVRREQYFHVHMGTNIGNLNELKEALTIMSDSSFRHHAGGGKNDFAAWVRGAVRDRELAKAIEKAVNREQMKDIIAARIIELEDAAAGETFQKDVRNTVLDFLMGMVVGFIIGLIVAMM